MREHFVICGLGRLGVRVADLLLSLGHPIIVITMSSRDEWIASIVERGGLVRIGDARDARLLREANIDCATALLAVTDSDLANLEIAFDARQIRKELPVVVRLFDQDLAQKLEGFLDLRRVLGTSAVAAPAFAASALGENAIASFTLEGEPWVAGRISSSIDSETLGLRGFVRLGEGSQSEPSPIVLGRAAAWHDLTGELRPLRSVERFRRAMQMLDPRPFARTLHQVWAGAPFVLRSLLMALVVFDVASVAVFASGLHLDVIDALYFTAATITTTGYGDITPLHAPFGLKAFSILVMLSSIAAAALVSSIITDFIVASRLDQALGAREIPDSGHVIVAGMGNVGYRTVRTLRESGTVVVAIDSDVANPLLADLRAAGPLVIGDARSAGILDRASVEGATSVVATTGDDATNLSIALAARRRNPAIRTVVRVFDAGFAAKVRDGLGLDAALSASATAAPHFVAAALHDEVHAAAVVGNHLIALVEKQGGTQPIGDELLVRRPAESGFHPVHPGQTIESGDRVVIAVRHLLKD